MSSYTIKAGDNLWSITREYYGNSLSNSELEQKVNVLIEYNQIPDSSKISIGQKLDLSCFDEVFPEKHTIQSGDTL